MAQARDDSLTPGAAELDDARGRSDVDVATERVLVVEVGAGVLGSAVRALNPTPREEKAQPGRCRSAGVVEGGSGGLGAKPPSICF